jgi:hypothetical protein
MTHRLDRVQSTLQRTDAHVSGSSVKTPGHQDDAHRIARSERLKNCPDHRIHLPAPVRLTSALGNSVSLAATAWLTTTRSTGLSP